MSQPHNLIKAFMSASSVNLRFYSLVNVFINVWGVTTHERIFGCVSLRHTLFFLEKKMNYDTSFLRELRGLGNHINDLNGAYNIEYIVARCIQIKTQLKKLEKTGKGKDGRSYEKRERKKYELINEYIGLCSCGTQEIKAVRETARCYNYFIESIELELKKSIDSNEI